MFRWLWVLCFAQIWILNKENVSTFPNLDFKFWNSKAKKEVALFRAVAVSQYTYGRVGKTPPVKLVLFCPVPVADRQEEHCNRWWICVSLKFNATPLYLLEQFKWAENRVCLLGLILVHMWDRITLETLIRVLWIMWKNFCLKFNVTLTMCNLGPRSSYKEKPVPGFLQHLPPNSPIPILCKLNALKWILCADSAV